jgi:4-amino-4-deoxy-L-arabinose transferase-like glycosyltransferase
VTFGKNLLANSQLAGCSRKQLESRFRNPLCYGQRRLQAVSRCQLIENFRFRWHWCKPILIKGPTRIEMHFSSEGAVTEPVKFRVARANRLVLPTFLLLAYVLQCVWFARTQSFTFDEPLHITTGLDNWRFNRFDLVLEHPPLGHLLPTLPIAFGNWEIAWSDPQIEGILVTGITDPIGMAMRVRLVNVALGVFLGIALWFVTRNTFSEGAANLVVALFAFSPSLIANFTLVTTDGVTTLMVFLTAVQVIRWRTDRSSRATLLLGVILGFLLLAKLSTPPVFCLTLALILVLKPNGWEWSPRRWNWYPMFVAFGLALFVLWGGYFFHVSHLKIGDGRVEMMFPNRPAFAKDSVGRVVGFMRRPLQHHLTLPVPAGEYLEGIADLVVHNQNGHKTFLLGQSERTQRFWFQPALALLKWPPSILLLFFCGSFFLVTRRVRPKTDLVVLLLFPASFLFFQMVMSRISTGERHFLPVYPIVLLICGATWEWARNKGEPVEERSSQPKRFLLWLLVLAVLFNVADVLRYAPGYLSYCNVLIPNRKSYKYFSDSNLDWGQGLIALRQYQDQHPSEQIWLAYFGSVDPAVYGIRAKSLKEGQKVSGTVVVGATNLAGEYLSDPDGYRWVTKYPLKTILDHCMFVYTVPPDANLRDR